MKNLISVHDVNKGDEKFLLKVHNASVKGQYLNSNKIVKYSDHARWFKLKLKSSNSQIYIGKKNSIRFGYVRFDKVQKGIYEVSLGNLPKFYGKGLGSKILKTSISKFTKKFKPKKIIAVVKKTNLRSQKTFFKNKFTIKSLNKRKQKTINKFNKQKQNYFELIK